MAESGVLQSIETEVVKDQEEIKAEPVNDTSAQMFIEVNDRQNYEEPLVLSQLQSKSPSYSHTASPTRSILKRL